jgi:hypothetical protein
VEIAPDELAAFMRMFKEKQQGGAVPDLDTSTVNNLTAADSTTADDISGKDTNTDKEDTI